MKAMKPPPAAARDLNSVEMARVWIAERGLHCAINVGIYADRSDVSEPAAWGIILADLTRHLSRALSNEAHDPGALIAEIRASYLRELKDPTSDIEGGFR